MKFKFLKRFLCVTLAASMALSLFAGCKKSGNGESDAGEGQADGLVIDPSDVAVRVGDYESDALELYFYYCLYKFQYESSYGIDDWSVQLSDGVTYGDYLKDQVSNSVVQQIYLQGKAEEMNIQLSEEEMAADEKDAETYLGYYSEEEIKMYGFTKENVTQILHKASKAKLAYQKLLEEAESRLTAEDKAACHYRAVQHILVSTMDMPPMTDADGNEVEATQEYIDAYQAEKKARADEVYAKVKGGADFEETAKEYTDDGGLEYALDKNGLSPEGTPYDKDFTAAALSLKEGQISEPVKTQFGYHIIKCVSTDSEKYNQQAVSNLAAQKMNDEYADFLDRNPYEFYSTWVEMVVK